MARDFSKNHTTTYFYSGSNFEPTVAGYIDANDEVLHILKLDWPWFEVWLKGRAHAEKLRDLLTSYLAATPSDEELIAADHQEAK